MSINIKIKFLCFITVGLLAQTGLCQSKQKFIFPPYTSGESSIDVYNELTFAATDKNERVNDLYLEAKFNFYTYFTKNIYMFNSFLIEPVKDAEYGENRYFDDTGLWWSNLNFNFENDDLLLGIGRGAPNFSTGYATAPGIWGSDDSYDNLKVGGKWGAVLAPNIKIDKVTNFSVSGALFTADNTTLTDSYITQRGVFYREYGGPSNTGDLDSYSLSIDATQIKGVENLVLHGAYMNQRVTHLSFDRVNYVSQDSLSNEQRFVVSAFYTFKLNEENVLSPYFEYGNISNSLGLKGNNKGVTTASLELNSNQWTHSLAYSNVLQTDNTQTTEKDYQVSLSTAYLFDNGLEVSLGYQFTNNIDEEKRHVLGTSLSFNLNSRNNVLLGSDFLKLNHKKQIIIVKRFVNSHDKLFDQESEQVIEVLTDKVVKHIKTHPNALNRPLKLIITNVLLDTG